MVVAGCWVVVVGDLGLTVRTSHREGVPGPHRNAPFGPPPLNKIFSILNLHIKEANLWAITLRENDVMIGTISLNNLSNDRFFGKGAEIGFVLDDTYWNQGIVTEAVLVVMNYVFRELKFDY